MVPEPGPDFRPFKSGAQSEDRLLDLTHEARVVYVQWRSCGLLTYFVVILQVLSDEWEDVVRVD